ncbi:DsbA family oxidoreductase [Nocardioides limicola]|uniref:DsbA family oxidoreductase n=1 Tax=Nocardioides limicola TaxID=2803368 RepID=UPI00193BE1CB|nr:DsbA family oxidoreductase [Nocardioides sp. DJM-14]
MTRIEAWADVTCPWCWIGQHRLERAIAAAGYDVTVRYRSFHIDPGAPRVPTESTLSALARKIGRSPAETRQVMEHAAKVAATLGLTFDHADAPHAHTLDAHRVLHLAAEHGAQASVKHALHAAYLARGESMADVDVLRHAAVSGGLPEDEVSELLAGDALTAAVAADLQWARQVGVTAVPALLVDDTYLLVGDQPAEVLQDMLRQVNGD